MDAVKVKQYAHCTGTYYAGSKYAVTLRDLQQYIFVERSRIAALCDRQFMVHFGINIVHRPVHFIPCFLFNN